jgi:hypothetical protein
MTNKLDWLEEENGILRGYEFKWNENQKNHSFLGISEASFEVIRWLGIDHLIMVHRILEKRD